MDGGPSGEFSGVSHAAELLAELSGTIPISLHTVGISIGSASAIDRAHLGRIRSLADRMNPALISGHLAWSTHRHEYLNDLLPLPYTRETLELVAEHVKEVQDYLGRPYLVENPATYVAFAASTMTEPDFLGELVARTDCRLLCDVSNIHVSAQNMGYDPLAYIDRFPADGIAEIHLGGYTPEPDPADPGQEILIDTHASSISDASWELYAYAIERFGPRPTLIEWDSDLPPLSELVIEAGRADVLSGLVKEAFADAVAG